MRILIAHEEHLLNHFLVFFKKKDKITAVSLEHMIVLLKVLNFMVVTNIFKFT